MYLSHPRLVQIATPWQVAVATIYAYPRYVDVVAAINAVAEDAGEPAVEEMQGACFGNSHANSSSCADADLAICPRSGFQPAVGTRQI